MADSDYRILADALEALDDGLGVYDADDHLIAFNSQYARVRTAIGGKVYLGARWDDLIVAGLLAGGIVEALGHEEQWLEERRRLRGAYHMVRTLPDGQRFQVSEKRLPNGGIAAVWTTIPRRTPPAAAEPEPATRPRAVAWPATLACDPEALRAKVRWLRTQAAHAAPEFRGTYLQLAEECDRLIGQTTVRPRPRH